jgi:tRNA-dihydrouridine synthase A
VPPLDYELVYEIKRTHPDLTIVINGGVATLDEAQTHLAHVDGVMMGRAAYQTPAILADVDSRLFAEPLRDVNDAVEAYADYVGVRLSEGVPLNAMTKHMLGLFHGLPGARQFRRHLSENACRKGAGLAVLREALGFIGRPRAAAA